MTDGQNNPNKLPDEDWAMAEPDIPVKKDSQKNQVDENVANLYDPIDTGDLAGWDINAPSLELPPLQLDMEFAFDLKQMPLRSEAEKPPPDLQQTEEEIQTPPQAFEVIKPAVPPKIPADDWGMSPPTLPNQDDWKMPDPIFRVSEGRTYENPGKYSSQTTAPLSHIPPAAESLSEIYAPPDAGETGELLTEDFGVSGADTGDFQEFDSSSEIADRPTPSVRSYTSEKSADKKRGWMFLVLAFIAIGLFVGLIILVALFYFGTNLNRFWQ